MPRWIRRRTAEQNYKRRRWERFLERYLKEMRRRMYRELKSRIVERIVEEHGEIIRLRNEMKQELEKALKCGRKFVLRERVYEHLLQMLVDDEVLRVMSAGRLWRAILLNFLRNVEAEATIVHEDIFVSLKGTIYNALGFTWEHVRVFHAMMRTLGLLRKVFSFIRNPSTRVLTEIYQQFEYLRQLLNLPSRVTLIYHDVCYADRALMRFDGRLPSRIYAALSVLKVTFHVAGTFGLFVAMLALLGNIVQKMDGEWITTAKAIADLATSMHDRVAVLRDDANRYVVTYPLWFVMERPDRLEKFHAKALGRRELVDYTVHCSIYREPLASRKAWAPRYSMRISKVRRLTVRVPMRFWGGT